METGKSAAGGGKTVKFIDLFAGIGGIRKGFEAAFNKCGLKTKCVLTSEIKPHAIKVLHANHPEELIVGDITKIDAKEIPDFDFLLGGFPCQAFSYAGRRFGFMDTRGTLFFEVERILREKLPYGFLLENVEGLVAHDRDDKKQEIGRTLTVILSKLNDLGYNVSWRVLDAKCFGLAQERKRVYIVGTKRGNVSLDDFPVTYASVADILEHNQPTVNTRFTRLLMSRFTPEELYGKSVKDKRGGSNNIHSWDICMKGEVSEEQKKLLDMMSHERRKKKWAAIHGIDWMDGMPLTEKMIAEFYPSECLHEMLEDLVKKGYLKKEYPKALVTEQTRLGGRRVRKQDTTKTIGYNIVSGKLSFEVSKILDPNGVAPTLVAMDMKKIYVVDNGGLRPLTLREGLRLFGYADNFKFPVTQEEGYDLLGNTVAVPVIAAVAGRMLEAYKTNNS